MPYARQTFNYQENWSSLTLDQKAIVEDFLQIAKENNTFFTDSVISKVEEMISDADNLTEEDVKLFIEAKNSLDAILWSEDQDQEKINELQALLNKLDDSSDADLMNAINQNEKTREMEPKTKEEVFKRKALLVTLLIGAVAATGAYASGVLDSYLPTKGKDKKNNATGESTAEKLKVQKVVQKTAPIEPDPNNETDPNKVKHSGPDTIAFVNGKIKPTSRLNASAVIFFNNYKKGNVPGLNNMHNIISKYIASVSGSYDFTKNDIHKHIQGNLNSMLGDFQTICRVWKNAKGNKAVFAISMNDDPVFGKLRAEKADLDEHADQVRYEANMQHIEDYLLGTAEVLLKKEKLNQKITEKDNEAYLLETYRFYKKHPDMFDEVEERRRKLINYYDASRKQASEKRVDEDFDELMERAEKRVKETDITKVEKPRVELTEKEKKESEELDALLGGM